MRYHWIPWIQTSSTHSMTSYQVIQILRHFECWGKAFFRYFSYNSCLIFFKIATDYLQTKPHKSYPMAFWFSQQFVSYSQSNWCGRIYVAAILNEWIYFFFATSPIKRVQSSPNLAQIIFRQSLTNYITCFFDFLNLLTGTANQSHQPSHHKGSEVISQHLFTALTPNLE